MDVHEAEARRAHCLVLDVRMPYEFEAGHIEGAVNVPLQALPAHVDRLDPGVPVLCVCQVGQRSDLAARFLAAREFTAFNVEGGVAAWSAAGFPLVGSGGGSGALEDGYTRSREW